MKQGILYVFSTLSLCAELVLCQSSSSNDGGINSQLRLAYAGPTGMTVSWNTFDQLSRPTVHYGLSPCKLDKTAYSSVSVTYPTSMTYNNHVEIQGLLPDTTYYYLPDNLMNMHSGSPYSFTTSKAKGKADPFSVAVVVDLGAMGPEGLTTSAGTGIPAADILKPGEQNTIQSLTRTRDDFAFLWHPGDIAYADYWLKEEIQNFLPTTTTQDGAKVYESILNSFYDDMAGLTAYKPYMVGPGNHEANCDNGGTTNGTTTYTVDICVEGQRNFTGYRNHFRMPSKASGGTDNFWYSWDYGMTHFITFNTETDLGEGYIGNDEVGGSEGQDSGPFGSYPNAQVDWVRNDLASVDRTVTPWVVVAGHRPWYLSHANASGTVCWTCKDVYEPLFIEYGVDLVLSGHSHVYERQAPLANGVADPNELNNPSAPWYITNGIAGHYGGLDSLQSPRQTYSRFGIDLSNGTYAWSKLTFHNASHLTHDLVNSSSGDVIDSATLYKSRPVHLI